MYHNIITRMELYYHRIKMTNVKREKNNCVTNMSMSGITIDTFNGGCLFLHDNSLTIQSSQFSINYGDSIVSILQSKESINVGQVNSQNFLIDNVTANDDYGNTFLLIQNQTNDDSVMITDSEFGSSNLEYIIYATSDGEITRIELANNHFHDCNISALLWTSKHNDTNTTGVQDDNNGNVRLELTVTSNEFNILVMNGLVGHL